MPDITLTGDYKQAKVFPMSGGDKGISLGHLLDIATERAMILARAACVRDTSLAQTEHIRGQYAEVQNLIMAIKELLPGPQDPNF